MSADVPRAASAVLFEAAAASPDRVRFTEPEEVTLGELAARVRAVATWLSERGLGPGDHAAIWADNSLEWIVAALAIQAAGAAFVSIHAPCSAEQAAFIQEDAGTVLLVSDAARAPAAALVLDGPSFAEALATEPGTLPGVDADARAALIYTSGTTGDPKGVVLTHRNLWVNGSDWLQIVGPLLPEDAAEVHWLPLSHIYGWGCVCIGTVYGLQTALCGFGEVAEVAARVRPHLICGVPLLWDHLAPEATGGRLALGLSGAAPLSTATKERYAAAGLLLLEGYGLTETSPTLTLERPEQSDRSTVGVPYPSVEVRIADDGEVLARGPSVFGGYWNRDAQPIDADGWFHTGDLGAWRGGALVLTGRKKELIVLRGGKKVAPAPIEARFPAEAGRLVLVGEGQRSVAALLFRAGDGDPASHIEAINAAVARYERIRGVALIEELPSVDNGLLTPSLKLKRHLVVERYRAQIDGIYRDLEAR